MSHPLVRGLLWLAFLLVLLGEGRYRGFIAAWQVWLVLGSAIAVTVATLATAVSREPTCDHLGHDHRGTTWRGTVLHAVPLCAVLALGDGGLGQHALEHTGMWRPSAEPPVSARPLIPPFRPVLSMTPKRAGDLLPAGATADASVPLRLDLHRLYRPGALLGVERVVVIGKFQAATQVKPEQLPPGADPAQVHGSLYRFVMICCAADARPVMVTVIGEPPPAGLDPGTWVEVKGRWLRPEPAGLAGIAAERWSVVPAPENEYLAPY